jgi:hypothetical protein
VRIGETTLRRDLSAAEVRYEVFTRREGGVWRHFVERHLTRFFTVGDVTRLLETAGFRVAHVFGGYGKRMRPTKSAWHLVVVAEPSRKPGRL